MIPINARNILVELGCVHEGDYFFALKSSKVATKYINIDPLLTQPHHLHSIANALVSLVPSRHLEPYLTFAGPAVGAIPLVYEAARVMVEISGWRAQAVFAEKTPTGFSLQRAGFAAAVHKRVVVIVEDIATTGESAKKTAEAVRAAGGEVVCFCFIWNRGGVSEKDMGAPVYSLIEEPVQTWQPGEHPKWGVWPLVTDVGHPDTFQDYQGGRIKLLA
ncbi:MAG: phosphoribosyltransferase family protein [Patescibacteria group bacterium]